ncbi:MAG: hypothetical protein AMXMBFR77_22950 [Phycisphaerales bacterium]|nr:carbohydrate kinase family protein [Leptolyngbya sp.]MCZ7633787.1 hypothetical protein [Phycisphaerales bacterium]MDL1904690.1 carbohydrate kinase family protein [Synechococcales cyanobacterium CNB]GIK20443.1 MAG: hypothetical protein BroJett004_26070 [Planctomycetota bacterium]
MSRRERAEIARAAADAIERAGATGLSGRCALVGFDGFVDSIIRVVDRRRSMEGEDFERIGTIGEFAGRCAAAAGRSTNLELWVDEDRFGGNGPLTAGALGRLGVPVCFVGAVGREDDPTRIAPIYEPFASRCREVVSVAAPGHTDALEFDDGKIMLGKTRNVQAVTWERIVGTLGVEGLRRRAEEAALIVMVNWSLCGGVPGIWEGLIREVLPGLSARQGGRRVLIDISDPAKRSDSDLRGALAAMASMNTLVPVTLGLNLAEGERIARVLGVTGAEDSATYGESVLRLASSVRERAGLACVVVHVREGAGGATDGGAKAWFDGPFTARPRLSTGAGDHFNAGFGLAQAVGLALDECLAVGCAVSGAYVRDGESPTAERLVGFLRALPVPELG